jgi:hypothetical protein
MLTELKQNYDKVFVTHFRNIGGMLMPMSALRKHKITPYISSKGGAVRVKLIKGDKTLIGYSLCLDMDVYVKSDGIERAFQKACLETEKAEMDKKITRRKLRGRMNPEFHFLLD